MILRGPGEDLRPVHPGRAGGPLLVLDAPLSFWGGVDRRTGVVIDVHHPQCGQSVAGHVLAMRTGRGSSSSSSVLAEVLRNGVGPAAIVLTDIDLILSLGVIVARELYAVECPVVVVSGAGFARLRTGDRAELVATGGPIPGTADQACLTTISPPEHEPRPPYEPTQEDAPCRPTAP